MNALHTYQKPHAACITAVEVQEKDQAVFTVVYVVSILYARLLTELTGLCWKGCDSLAGIKAMAFEQHA